MYTLLLSSACAPRAEVGPTDTAAPVSEGLVSGPYLVLNEVIARPLDGPDQVEVYNAGNEVQSGSLCPDGPGTFVDVQPGTFHVFEPLAECGFALGSTDSVTLTDGDGFPVDGIAWEAGQCPEGGSLGRLPDGLGEWTTFARATPGTRNAEVVELSVCGDGVRQSGEVCDRSDLGDLTCGAMGFYDGAPTCNPYCSGVDYASCETWPPAQALLNEIGAEDEGFVELYNRDNQDVDVSGWTVTDRVAESERAYALPAGTVLSPGAVAAWSPDTFRIGPGEPIVLRDTEGHVRDYVVGPAQRMPDGADTWWAVTTASPGELNAP